MCIFCTRLIFSPAAKYFLFHFPPSFYPIKEGEKKKIEIFFFSELFIFSYPTYFFHPFSRGSHAEYDAPLPLYRIKFNFLGEHFYKREYVHCPAITNKSQNLYAVFSFEKQPFVEMTTFKFISLVCYTLFL